MEVQLHHSSSRQQMMVSGQLHTSAALLVGKSPRTKDRVDTTAGLDAMEKGSNPGRPSRNPSLNRLSYLDSCTSLPYYVADLLQSEMKLPWLETEGPIKNGTHTKAVTINNTNILDNISSRRLQNNGH
jgi:hypothetical protein